MAKRDLKSFVHGKQKAPSADQQAQAQDMLRQAQQLQGQSDAQLMEQLEQAISRGRQDGSFDADKLQQFVARVSPMLDAAQRKKLQEITAKL